MQSRGADRAIAALAERQHGVVARGQLLDAGVSRYALDRRIDQRRLHLVHRGVYAVGHPNLTIEGRWLAAVLAAGRDAVASHRAAAAIWGLRRSAHLEVTVPAARRDQPLVRVHRS